MNVVGLEAEGGQDWDKVARYFVNVAKWIAPKGVYRSVCWWDIILTHFSPVAIEELHPKAGLIDLGSVLYGHLAHIHGPCTVRQFVLEWISDTHPRLADILIKQFDRPEPPEPNWTFPHIDVIERVVLGGMALGTMPLAERIRSVALDEDRSLELSIDEVAKAASHGAEEGLARFSEEVMASRARRQSLRLRGGLSGDGCLRRSVAQPLCSRRSPGASSDPGCVRSAGLVRQRRAIRCG